MASSLSCTVIKNLLKFFALNFILEIISNFFFHLDNQSLTKQESIAYKNMDCYLPKRNLAKQNIQYLIM